MMIIVVTGGIGSGKSEVCRILDEMGFRAQYNADSRVKALYSERPELLAEMEKALGTDLRDAGGNFAPSRLAALIFNDKEALETVESIIFPALLDDFSSFARTRTDEKIIIFESATILEKPFFEGFGDKVILVSASYSTRKRRACARDGARPEAVQTRMDNQKLMNMLSECGEDVENVPEGCRRIDAVIVNDAGLEELKEKTKEVIKYLNT